MTAIGAALGLLMGVTLGIFGGGGSILTLPILIWVFGFGVKEAVVHSLLIVGTTALAGIARHWRRRTIDVSVIAVFAPIAMVGAWVGARLALRIPEIVQLALLATVMLLAGLAMFRSASRHAALATVGEGERPSRRRILHFAVEGLLVGALTGIVGVGGGFLIVPALVLVGGLSMERAIATSLVIIVLNSIAGIAGYAGSFSVDPGVLVLLTGTAIVGMAIGTQLLPHLPAPTLKKVFAVFLIVMSAFILVQNRGAASEVVSGRIGVDPPEPAAPLPTMERIP